MPLILLLFAVASVSYTPAGQASASLRPGGRVWLHAHNCYPEKGRWADRIERALATGARHLAIEQDIAWYVDPASGQGRSVVSHDTTLTGEEPTLEAHFFHRVGPLLTRAVEEDRRDTWPVLVLHLDFKSNEPAHHQAIWDLLGRYESWLTTAERSGDGRVTPFQPGPLLVLTEAGLGQEEAFFTRVPIGDRLRLFGTIPPLSFPEGTPTAERNATWFASPPDTLIPTGATAYRRWVNFPWAAVEEGGQAKAGPWTAADERRLSGLVDRAHEAGLWIRFYTLNGHAPGAGLGWTESYNFGSAAAVEPRWRAAVAAGVEFVATDQYEDFARLLPR